jgi:AraC family transcriptional regulator
MLGNRSFVVLDFLPDPSTIDVDRPCHIYGWPNMVLCGKQSEYYFPDHDAPLSLHCNYKGTASYEESGQRYRVDDSSYMLFNEGQRYSITIRSDEPVEAFYIFFRPHYAQEVHASLFHEQRYLLDDPSSAHQGTIHFIDAKYDHNDVVSPYLGRIHGLMQLGMATDEHLEEEFSLLMGAMLRSQYDTLQHMERLPALKLATRVELYKRLLRARDFIESSYTSEIPLTRIANEAYLSPHHFLRQFKLLFGKTPHQYVVSKRLELALRLLQDNTISITEICSKVGFESLGSFSWMFKKKFGVSPDQYRKNKTTIIIT